MRLLSIAALQISPVVHDMEATLRDFEQRVGTLAETFNGLQLVVVPELHLAAVGGMYDEQPGSASSSAVEIPGPLTERLGSLARETGLWLVPGSLYERAGSEGGVHNTAVAISPEGEVVAAYRKCFPWQPYEESIPGTRLVTFEVPEVGRIGLAICHDGAFPEVFRQLAWMGAEVILQPTLTTTIDRDAELALARANAIANQVYVVNVNAPAPTALGRSVVIDPEGLVRTESGAGEETITDVLDLDAVTRVRTHGSFGLNRLLDQLDELGPKLELPMYGGYVPRGLPIGDEGR
ncbi:MAG TPA: carbon-nitrogen hydrolase family protein [Solirubrobacteraceae bacterium]|nr:carbon-nitrogen hydrolase family protein [Solirubrobacteraceae bacterium]